MQTEFDAGERTYAANVVPIPVAGYANVYCVEVTEAKRAEAARRAFEERFSNIFYGHPAPLVLSDGETGNNLEVNEGMCRLLGYRRDEIVGRDGRELGIWKRIEDRDRIVAETLAGQPARDLPIRWVAKRGALVDVLLRTEAIMVGDAPCVLWMAADLTERLRAERQLRESRALFDAFVQHFPGPAFMKDEAARIIWTSPSFDEELGLRSADILGKTSGEFRPPEVAEEIARHDRVVLVEGKSIQELEHLPGRVGMRAFLMTRFLIERRKGPPMLGAVGIDVTEALAQREELARLTVRLRTISAIDAATLRAEPLKDVLRVATQRVMDVLGTDRAGVILLDGDPPVARLAAIAFRTPMGLIPGAAYP